MYKGILQYAVMSGWVIGAALTCFAQTEAVPVPDRTQEVGPSTGDRVIEERPVQREQLGQKSNVYFIHSAGPGLR